MKHRRIIWEHLKWGIYKLTLIEADTEEYLDMQENTILNYIYQCNMKNIPKRIYLQIGDLTDKDDKNIDFNELSDVCWCSEKIFSTDIEFIRKPDAARKSVENIAKEVNGRSRACKECEYLMKCTPDISEICNKAFVNGYKKGYNEYKNRLK